MRLRRRARGEPRRAKARTTCYPDVVAEDLNDPKYWNDVYLEGTPGWDKGRASPPIARMIGEGIVPPGGWVCVVGAGKGHEAVALAKAGYRATAVDFAEEAVKAMRAAHAMLDIQQRDIFTLPADFTATFDAICEHTCFCAIDPKRRVEYADAMRTCLKPGGLLFGLFYDHGREGGPPFTTTEPEIRSIFEAGFTFERFLIAPDSLPERAGKEREFVFRRT